MPKTIYDPKKNTPRKIVPRSQWSEEARQRDNAWQREHMITLATKIRKEEAEAFREYAAAHNTTVSALISGFVRKTLGKEK